MIVGQIEWTQLTLDQFTKRNRKNNIGSYFCYVDAEKDFVDSIRAFVGGGTGDQV